MTTTNLKTAVERATSRMRSTDVNYIPVYPGGQKQFDEDCQTLAVAYLSEHPSDGGQVADIEWLNGLSNADGTKLGMLRVRLVDYKVHLMSPCLKLNEGIDGLGDWVAPNPATRDDIRMLCKALGIKLKESVK